MVVGWDGCISPDFVCFNHFHHALTGGWQKVFVELPIFVDAHA